VSTDAHHTIVIVGGGTAGITVAARLLNGDPTLDVAVIEPSDKHYYQPLWTLVGAGVFDREVTERNEADYMPAGATWIEDAVEGFDPDQKQVKTRGGKTVGYDQLVVCAGMQLNWNQIEGLEGNLGKGGICSNYSYATVNSTWKFLRSMQDGNAVFTFPKGQIKCGGAPQKITYLADHHLRRRGVRDRCNVIYAASTGGIFGVEKYARALRKVVARKQIDTHFQRNLVAVRPESREAVFEHLAGGDELVLRYELLHVVPPQSAPDFIRHSPLSNEEGWVDVHKHTLQHTRHADIFALGDCSSLPTARTGAAVRKQAPVLVENLLAHRKGAPPQASYDGYSSCPLVTGYGSLILAEFDYDGQPAESFPFDQSRERYSMYALKCYGLPELYWNGMLRGNV
jgi:sulfide:quinone oxidoreductase